MKKKLFILLFILSLKFTLFAQNSASLNNISKQSCTIIYASDNETAFAGNNEDSDNPFTNIWFIPATSNKYGRIYFGYDVEHFPQGGMNEYGLFF